MTCRPLLLAALVCQAGCAASDPDAVGGAAQEILGGSTDDGHDLGLALLLIRDANGRHIASCSASMLTRRVVMTAAHCTDDQTWSFETWYADAYNAETGTFTAPIDEVRRVAVAKWIDPAWRGEDETLGTGHDIALLLLDKPIPASVAPLPWLRQRLTSASRGATLRIAGFGDRVRGSQDPNHVKMTARNTVSELNNLELRIEGTTKLIANGDSGGPAFLTIDGRELVAGIASYGITGPTPEISAFTRVDLYIDEIDAFIAANDPQAASGCDVDGICGYLCSEVDPDCACTADGQCTAACAVPDSDPDCPLNCLQDAVCTREGCPMKDPDCGEKPTGDACAMNRECASDLCLTSDGAKICVPHCDAGGMCPKDYACQTGTTICLPSASSGCAVAPGSRGAGAGVALLILMLLGGVSASWRRLPLPRRRRW